MCSENRKQLKAEQISATSLTGWLNVYLHKTVRKTTKSCSFLTKSINSLSFNELQMLSRVALLGHVTIIVGGFTKVH